jgi:hypothetical protein
MSAAVAPLIWEAHRQQVAWRESRASAQGKPLPAVVKQPKTEEKPEPNVSLAFYRKHTERMLRRYLYASMQVGRSPSILGDPVARGWVSSRPVKTFEDAVIFVLDIEKCLDKLDSLERQMLSRDCSTGVHTVGDGTDAGNEPPRGLIQIPVGPGPAD